MTETTEIPEKPAKKKKEKRPRGTAVTIDGKCIACGARCETSCPINCIVMDDAGEPIIDGEKCIGCKKCVKVCPGDAIEIVYTKEELAKLEEMGIDPYEEKEELTEEEKAIQKVIRQYTGVWVAIEQTEGKAAEVSWELLGEGRKLANKLGVELCALVIGHNIQHICDEAFSYRADKCYKIDAEVFATYRTEPYFKAVCAMVDKHKPEIILMGATGWGRDLAGAVATQVGTGLTADCTGLDIDDKRNLMQTRPAFGGNIMATIMCDKYRPQMATVRPKVMQMPKITDTPKSELIEETVAIADKDIMTRVLEIIQDSKEDDVDVSSAEIIIAGGRGMMGGENFGILYELAEELGGVVAASRMAVDAGWISHTRQVGQTGKTVRPVVYVACGISGAIQHMVGMQDADIVIAINKDPEAPIFEVATFGIVGDLFEVVPALTERVKELKAEKSNS